MRGMLTTSGSEKLEDIGIDYLIVGNTLRAPRRTSYLRLNNVHHYSFRLELRRKSLVPYHGE